MKASRFLAVGLLGVAIGCGGGGGGHAGGPTAALNGMNGGTAGADVMDQTFGLRAGGIGALAVGGDDLAGFRLAPFLRRSIREATAADRAQPLHHDDEVEPCSFSGSVEVVHNGGSQVTAGDSYVFTLSGCDDGEYRMDGTIGIDVNSFVESGGFIASASLTLHLAVTVVVSDTTLDMAGDLVVSLSETETTWSIAIGFRDFTATRGADAMAISSASVTYSETDDGWNPPTYSFATTGSLTSSAVSGLVSWETVVPFEGMGSQWPSVGRMLVRGADGSSVRITAVDAGTVQVEVDADGDGAYELSDIRAWSDLSLPVLPPLVVEPAAMPDAVSGTWIDVTWGVRGGAGTPNVYAQATSVPEGIALTVEPSPDPTYDALVRFQGVARLDGSWTVGVSVGHEEWSRIDGIQVSTLWNVSKGPPVVMDTTPPSASPQFLVDPAHANDVVGLQDIIFNRFDVIEFHAAGGTPPYRAEAFDDPADAADEPPPLGMSFPPDSTSLVGAPQDAVQHTFRMTIRLTDGLGETAVRKFTLTVLTPQPIIVTTSMPDGTVGAAYSQTVEVVDGSPPFTWSVTAGSLPAGLTLNASTGRIDGTPLAVETRAFTVKVVDLASNSATKDLSITVN